MWLDEFCSPLVRRVCRHVPDGSPYDVLDPRFAAASADNRWNDEGQPTLYFGSAHEVLAVEWGRHFPRDATPEIGQRSRLRRIYDIDVAFDDVLDLRAADLWTALALDDAPYCFVDRDLCRQTARRLRARTRAQALIVPSLGLLDRHDVWGLVVFIDKLPSFPAPFVTSVQRDGLFGLLLEPPTKT